MRAKEIDWSAAAAVVSAVVCVMTWAGLGPQEVVSAISSVRDGIMVSAAVVFGLSLGRSSVLRSEMSAREYRKKQEHEREEAIVRVIRQVEPSSKAFLSVIYRRGHAFVDSRTIDDVKRNILLDPCPIMFETTSGSEVKCTINEDFKRFLEAHEDVFDTVSDEEVRLHDTSTCSQYRSYSYNHLSWYWYSDKEQPDRYVHTTQ